MGGRPRASMRISDRSAAAQHEHSRAEGLERCHEKVRHAFSHSKLPDLTIRLPKFDIHELETGVVLGKGQFGTISEVRAFNPQGTSSGTNYRASLFSKNVHYSFHDDDSESEDVQLPPDDTDSRRFLADHATRSNGEARYAVKVLSNNVMCDTESFLQGITDMAIETRILSNMNHPNIMKLRALAKVDAFNEYFFIVMDRLYDSLEDKLKQWENQRHRAQISCVVPKFLQPKKGPRAETNLYKEKIQVAYDLSDAIRYVHEKSIVYRDLKPENIAFDVRGDVRLFDFGLCKELKARDRRADGTYKMTQMGLGLEGDPKYIAPECANGDTYNESCDVYSFAIILWHIMSCHTPYDHYTTKREMQEHVWMTKGIAQGGAEEVRPHISESWPLPIKLLLKRSWAPDLHQRSSSKDVNEILRQECAALVNGKQSSLEHIKRRSTHQFEIEAEEASTHSGGTKKSKKKKGKKEKREKKSRKSKDDGSVSNARRSYTSSISSVNSASLSLDPRELRRSATGPDDASQNMDDGTSVASEMTASERREARQRSFEAHARKKAEAARRGGSGSHLTSSLSNTLGLDLPAGISGNAEIRNSLTKTMKDMNQSAGIYEVPVSPKKSKHRRSSISSKDLDLSPHSTSSKSSKSSRHRRSSSKSKDKALPPLDLENSDGDDDFHTGDHSSHSRRNGHRHSGSSHRNSSSRQKLQKKEMEMNGSLNGTERTDPESVIDAWSDPDD